MHLFYSFSPYLNSSHGKNLRSQEVSLKAVYLSICQDLNFTPASLDFNILDYFVWEVVQMAISTATKNKVRIWSKNRP